MDSQDTVLRPGQPGTEADEQTESPATESADDDRQPSAEEDAPAEPSGHAAPDPAAREDDGSADEAQDLAAAEEQVSVEDLAIVEKSSDADAERTRLRAMVEAAVYVTDEPLTAKQIAAALEAPLDMVHSALREIVAEYEKPEHGLAVREVAEGFKMATKAEHHEAIRAFVKKLRPPLKLSMAALETLAVIAYKQPITAPEIMEIRGVQGAGVLKTLLDRKLITTAGRKQVIGKPMQYKTTKDFLIQFGLRNLNELPTLKEFEELARMALGDGETDDSEQTDGRQQELALRPAKASETAAGTDQREPESAEAASDEPCPEDEDESVSEHPAPPPADTGDETSAGGEPRAPEPEERKAED